MGPFYFIEIWYIKVPGSGLLSPQGSNYALSSSGQGDPKAPANCYNVYMIDPETYILQSQLNGMYLSMPENVGIVCASIPDPARAQPFTPNYFQGYIVLFLPDKRFLGKGDDGHWVWRSDPSGIHVADLGGLQPSKWNVASLMNKEGTDGFTLHYVNLTGKVFPPGTDFTGVNFSGAILDELHLLRQCNLTKAVFTKCSLKKAILGSAFFAETIFNHANLTGAKLRSATWTKVKAVVATLDEADFTKAKLVYSDLTSATLNKTIFNNATLEGGTFTNCDWTSILADGVTVTSTQAQPVIFYNAKLNFPLINRNWQWMDLRNATIYDLPQTLSSAANPLQATGAKLSGLNQNSLKGVWLEHAVLDYALMDNLDLSDSHLASASLIDASLHGANLTNVKLPGANLTGAQLGTLSRLFALPLSTETALNAGQVATLVPYFTQHGIKLSSPATLKTLAENRVWRLNDAGNNMTYSIRLETQPDSTQALNVYKPATAASLVNAYMPNAVLTGANLYGVAANNIQFYGNKARIDGSAILEEAQLNNSNLSNLNLTQAQLLGTNLSGSYLFNAKFNKARLIPSANGVTANLSDANLQGADFTDAQLYGANLANAAVAISTPTTANPNQGGVYLFSLPYSGDTRTAQQYMAELNAASAKFSLNPQGDAPTLQKYVTALETNNLNVLKIPFLEQHPSIHLSANAQIKTITGGSVWQIVDGTESYTLWTDIDQNGNTELYAAPSLTNMQAAFHQNGITLRWQASAAIDKAGQQWLIDNDSQNPQNFSLGYVRFILKLDNSVLDVYGTAVRIERLGDKNQLQIDTETCNVTKLTVTNMNAQTICPNGTKLSTNQNTGGVQWDARWLRASAPPAPPTCVPTNNSWCPPTQTRTQSDKDGPE